MAAIPAKVADRLVGAIKRFQPILSSARARDVNESDTVTIVVDLLAELFGYDKYSEVTKEFAIRSTYCDLAIKIDGQCQFLIEVKAIGLDLKEQHTKQAIDYAANQGVEWVALTNGFIWKVYRVVFAKPIDQELVAEIDLLTLSPRNTHHVEQLFLLSREGWVKSSLSAYYTQRQATNRFFLGQLMLTDPIVEVIRRELRRYAPDVKVQPDEIRDALLNEVLKREVVEGDKSEEARKRIEKVQKSAAAVVKGRRERAPAIAIPGALETPAASGAPVDPVALEHAIDAVVSSESTSEV